MSVFMDIAVGNASLQKSQEEAYSRACDYLQEIHTQVGCMNIHNIYTGSDDHLMAAAVWLATSSV